MFTKTNNATGIIKAHSSQSFNFMVQYGNKKNIINDKKSGIIKPTIEKIVALQ